MDMPEQLKDDELRLVVDSRLASVADALMAAVRDLGFELVRITFGAGRETTLQIMAERPNGEEITVGDCGAISRTVSELLDAADPVADAYMLEVSSPGIDRPLTRRKDFERWTGFELRLETTEPLADRVRFHGRLLGLWDDTLHLREEGGEVAIPFTLLKRVKLVLNDELLAATKRAAA